MYIILCLKTAYRNLPKPSLSLPNRHKKSNWPKKASPFSKNEKKAKGLDKKPKMTNLASKKPHWQPCKIFKFCSAFVTISEDDVTVSIHDNEHISIRNNEHSLRMLNIRDNQ